MSSLKIPDLHLDLYTIRDQFLSRKKDCFVLRFHEQMEAEEKELAKIGTEIKPWTLNDEDKNIVEPSPLGKTLFGVIEAFYLILEFLCREPRFLFLFMVAFEAPYFLQ
jgi:hypothetical protein